MVGHPGADARPSERWTEMGLVVATDPAPGTRKTDLLQGAESVARKTKGGRAGGRSTYWRCHTRPCSTPPCQSCFGCRHSRRKRMARTSPRSHQSTSGRSLLGTAPSRLVQSTPLVRGDVGTTFSMKRYRLTVHAHVYFLNGMSPPRGNSRWVHWAASAKPLLRNLMTQQEYLGNKAVHSELLQCAALSGNKRVPAEGEPIFQLR